MRADSMTASAGGASFNTQASNLSRRSRSAESEPRTTGSMPKCRKHSEIMALAGSLRSIRAALAEDFRIGGEGAEADAKWLSMGLILTCRRKLGKSEEGQCPSTKVQPGECPVSRESDEREDGFALAFGNHPRRFGEEAGTQERKGGVSESKSRLTPSNGGTAKLHWCRQTRTSWTWHTRPRSCGHAWERNPDHTPGRDLPN